MRTCSVSSFRRLSANGSQGSSVARNRWLEDFEVFEHSEKAGRAKPLSDLRFARIFLREASGSKFEGRSCVVVSWF